MHPVKPVVWPQLANFDVSTNRTKVPCKYVLSKHCLGNGSFSKVFEGKHVETHGHFAVKLISKKNNRNKLKLIQNEFRILSKIASNGTHEQDNPRKYLLKLYDYFETDENFYLITDLAIGGDLFDKILNDGCYRVESDGIRIINSILSGMVFLKKQNIIHRDLKAENIFFKYGSSRFDILIGDFGLSTYAKPAENGSVAEAQEDEDDMSNILCGTLSYMAPEILLRKPYSFPVDVWSLGVLIYFMYCGYMPFDCETDDETKEAILTADYMFEPPEYWDHVSGNMRQVIADCFSIDPAKRATVEDLHSNQTLSRFNRSSSAASLSNANSSTNKNANSSSKALFTFSDAAHKGNNSHTDLKRFDSPIIEDPETTTEEEGGSKLIGTDGSSMTSSSSSASLNTTRNQDNLTGHAVNNNAHNDNNHAGYDEEDDKEREEALNSLRESLYGSLKSAAGSNESTLGSRRFGHYDQKSQRNNTSKNTHSSQNAVSANSHSSNHNNKSSNSKSSKATFSLGGGSGNLQPSNKSFSYTNLRDLNSKRSLSNSSMKDLFSIGLLHSKSNSNLSNVVITNSNTKHPSSSAVQMSKMNGALCAEPEVQSIFRLASAIANRSNFNSRMNSTFNSINPSRINSRNQSKVQSRIPSRVPSRNHSRNHSANPSGVASAVHSRVHSRAGSIYEKVT